MLIHYYYRPKNGIPLPNIPVKEERISLSIVFRISNASAHEIAEQEDLTITNDSSNAWTSLDLIIPSHNDYELLIRTLQVLIDQNKIYRMSMSRDVLLLQQQWMDMGKSLSSNINEKEWTTLCCDRLSAPVSRNAIKSLYHKFCNALNTNPDEGVSLPLTVGMLEHARKLSLHMENKTDPCDVIWNILIQHNLNSGSPVYDSDDSDGSTMRVQTKIKSSSAGSTEKVSAAAFLMFMQSQQKNTKTSLKEVKDLFERLNSVTTASQVMDDGVSRKEESINVSREHISKAVFLNYILSDTNDAFDPARGQYEEDDMTQPLCSYWINSSHDTYLNEVPPCIVDNVIEKNFAGFPVNLKMYATALYRGCRCLEVDVWDGESIQKGQPVIKFDSVKRTISLSKTPNSYGDEQTKVESILFSDVLWLVRTFLLSNPKTLPVLLFIENHCSLPNQEKMAQDISNILCNDDMVFIPKSRNSVLPSPHEMRGKVVIKFKIGENSALFDDFDEDNDVDLDTNDNLEDDTSVISDTLLNGKSAHELELEAARDLSAAKAEAAKAEKEAFDAKVKANRAKEFAKELLKQANMTSKEAAMKLKGIVEEPKNVTKSNNNNETNRSTPKHANVKKARKSPSKPKTAPKPKTWSQFFFGGDDDENEDCSSVSDEEYDEYGVADSDSYDVVDSVSYDVVDSVSYDSALSGNYDDVEVESSMNDTVEKKSKSRQHQLPRPKRVQPIKKKANEEWVESTPEFRQYKAAIAKKLEIPHEGSNVEQVEKQLDLFKQHAGDDGVEVEHYFSNKVDLDLMGYSEAEKKNLKASEILAEASAVLEKCKKEYNDANRALAAGKARAKQNRSVAQKKKEDTKNKIKSEDEVLKTQLKKLEIDQVEGRRNLELKNKEAAKYEETCESLRKSILLFKTKVSSAKSTAENATSEAQISADRLVMIEEKSKNAAKDAKIKAEKAEGEAQKEKIASDRVNTERKVVHEVMKNFKVVEDKWRTLSDGLERLKIEIRQIERSSEYHKERKQAQAGTLEGSGVVRQKLKMKVDQKFDLEEKLQKASADKRIHESKVKEAEKYLKDALKPFNVQSEKATKARRIADDAENVAERLAEQLMEEKEATMMRKEANSKATNTVEQLDAQLAKLQKDLSVAEKNVVEAKSASLQIKTNLESLAAKKDQLSNKSANQLKVGKQTVSKIIIPNENEGLDEHLVIIEKTRKQLRSAEKAYQKALEEHDWTVKELDKAREALNINADEYYKAKIDATLVEQRLSAEKKSVEKAMSAYERYKNLAKESTEASDYAAKCQSVAAEKAYAHQRAIDYTKKKSMVLPISKKLSDMTLLHSVKFKYFEKSKVLPFNNLHNFSEGKIHQMYENGRDDMDGMIEFNKTHMTRVFPSKHKSLRSNSNNYNPVLAWSLGCQVASMNQQLCDAFILVNDGRFRVNGSCGYVLKPESMIERKGGDIRRKAAERLPQNWTIKILSGYNLPKPRRKALTGTIDPRVRVTLFDGGKNTPPTVHVTETLRKNGLNPVWDETKGTNFKVNDPSTAIMLFSLWDAYGDDGEDFIAAAAIPMSCMRQGYRSIPMFDANHMRCGSHGSAMLLVRIDAK